MCGQAQAVHPFIDILLADTGPEPLALQPVAGTCQFCQQLAALTQLGLVELTKFINRSTYPEATHPYGQWDYQKFYELEFEKAHKFFDADPRSFLRAAYTRGDPGKLGKPAFSSNVVKDGGWFGGIEKPDPKWRQIPNEMMCIDEEVYEELATAMERTGFFGETFHLSFSPSQVRELMVNFTGADSWYHNHDRNRKYFLEKAAHGGYLHMPILFIEAKYDTICDTVTTRLAEPQRNYCTNLTVSRLSYLNPRDYDD